jgi:dipeptidase E
MRLLLISNSGRPFLAHCKDLIGAFLGDHKTVHFIAAAPFIDEREYTVRVSEALELLGVTVIHLELERHPLALLANAEVVMVGGGNTYRLLKRVSEANLIEPLRQRVLHGLPYIGWSAGANLAGQNILTTNDWNVVGWRDFVALRLVPFNINPHYLETDPAMAPHSETRDMRIAEYHKVHLNPVLGIEEATSVLVTNDRYEVRGAGRVRLFRPNFAPVDFLDRQIIKLN